MDAPTPVASVQSGTDQDLIESLRVGDDATFAGLVRAWSPAMLRLARNFVSTSQSAEDAVQDVWLGMLSGLDRFEGRASLRTWTFSILVNRAKSRGVRESRTVVDLRAADDDGNGRPGRPARGLPGISPTDDRTARQHLKPSPQHGLISLARRPMVTAAVANDVDEMNQQAAPM